MFSYMGEADNLPLICGPLSAFYSHVSEGRFWSTVEVARHYIAVRAGSHVASFLGN